MSNKNSGVKSAFAQGAGIKASSTKKCPPGFYRNSEGKCVKRHNPWGEKSKKNPTNSSQTTGP